MDLKHLEYIIAIAEEKNISRAADKLYMSQPTLSQYLLKLEQDIGVCLFNRIKNALTLTYAGEIYVQAAKEILNTKKQTSNIIEDIIDYKKGHIIIGVAPDRGATILPSVIPKFLEKYPGIKIDLVEENAKQLETLTLQGHIDFTIAVYYAQEIQLDYEFLCSEEIILAVPKSHRLAHLAANAIPGKKPVVDLLLFKDDPFVLMKHGTKIRQITDNIFKDAGFSPNIILESGSINTIQYMAANNAALSILPEKFFNYPAIGDNLVYFSINPEKYYWPIIATFRKNNYLTRAAKDFISILKSYLNSTSPLLKVEPK